MVVKRGRTQLRMMFIKFRLAILVSLFFGGLVAIAPAQEDKGSSRRALGYYADAAGYQNNAAYELAIEEWQKLLKEFPKDPLVGKASHYLGVCYIQLEQPDYPKAIVAFRRALEEKKLDVREESLINLSWCLFNRARESEPDSATQKRGFEEAKRQLVDFLKQYGNGQYLDQALFYLGEIEYSLGNTRQSISYYKKLLDRRDLAKSELRPDARYAIAIAYEEQKDVSNATREYNTFLKEHREHRLANEVRVRLADLLLAGKRPAEAEGLLAPLATAGQPMADYALLRLGYAQSQQGKSDAATQQYLKLLREYPDSKHAKTAALSVGQSLFSSGKYAQAIEQFNLVLKSKDSQAAEAAHWLAITLLRQNKPQEALTLLEEALQWARNTESSIALQLDYADALYALPQQLEKARAAYELIARDHAQHPLAPRAAYNAGFAALQLGQFTDARQLSEQFLARYPSDPLRNDVAYVAAEALLQEGEHEAAAKAYAKLRAADRQNPAFPMWTLRLAMANYLSGKYQTAIGLLNNELQSFQEDDQRAEAQFILGASYLYEEEPRKAIAHLVDSHTTSDRWSSADEVLLVLAEAHQRNKDNIAAKKTLENLLKKYPSTRLKAQVDYKLAQLSAAMNQLDEAISKYRSIVRNPEASNFHSFASYGIAWCLMQQDQHAEALRQLQDLLHSGSAQGSIGGEAKLAEGVCLRKLGKTDQAVRSLKSYLNSSPEGTSLANTLYELGLAYTEQGELSQANRQFNRILREVPQYVAKDKVVYELAWNHQEASKPEQAAQYFEQLAQQFPNSEFAPEASYMLAQQMYDAKKYERAATVYTSVLSRTQDPQLSEKAQYKLGWCLFQQKLYQPAARQFSEQAKRFASGPLAVDALFMLAECSFKQDQFETALEGYKQARRLLESTSQNSAASKQVQTLIYLHGAQCLREQQQWTACQQWLEVIPRQFPESPYLPTALYELGYCKQNQNQIDEALAHYSEVANNYRTEVAARSRFMMGEVYFSQRDFAKAIPEFQRVMFGFGGDKAPESIKNWQVKSAFEAARCSEVLIENLGGASRDKIMKTAQNFYRFIVEKHASHELAAQAQTRLGELRKLR